MTLNEIGKLAEEFSSAYSEMLVLGQAIDAAVLELQREFCDKYRRLAERVATRHAKLHAAIEGNPELWVKPRTQVLAGVQVGMKKGAGGISYGEPDDVVRRIHKVFGDEATQYLHVKECPDKEAMAKLTVSELEKLGCSVQNSSDQVVIKPVTGEMSKLASQFLRQLKDVEEGGVR